LIRATIQRIQLEIKDLKGMISQQKAEFGEMLKELEVKLKMEKEESKKNRWNQATNVKISEDGLHVTSEIINYFEVSQMSSSVL
jgi:thiamine biosynthesis lipoprotein ApbE